MAEMNSINYSNSLLAVYIAIGFKRPIAGEYAHHNRPFATLHVQMKTQNERNKWQNENKNSLEIS